MRISIPKILRFEKISDNTVAVSVVFNAFLSFLNHSDIDDLLEIQETFTSYSGLADFQDGQRIAQVNISTIDDTTPEPEKTFIFKIVDVYSGEEVAMDGETPVIDVKDDSLKFQGT